MLSNSVWIVGSSRSGKTARLVEHFCTWVQSEIDGLRQVSNRRQMRNNRERLNVQQVEPAVLVLAANDDNRRELADRIVAATEGKYPIRSKTQLGFFQDSTLR